MSLLRSPCLTHFAAITAAILATAGFAAPGHAAELVLGKKLLIKNPTGNEANRSVRVQAMESGTDVAFDSRVPSDVATLRVVVHGSTSSDQMYTLGPPGVWRTVGTLSGPVGPGESGGLKYRGGDPVKALVVKKTRSGKFLIKATLAGNAGFASLDVVPPNVGIDGSIILNLHNPDGGNTYCAGFGGAAGGTVKASSATVWSIASPTARPDCPVGPPLPACSPVTSLCGGCIGGGYCYIRLPLGGTGCTSGLHGSCSEDAQCGPGEVCVWSGDGDVSPQCGVPCPGLMPKRVFVTSQMYDGALGNLAGADAKCSAAAVAGGARFAGGTYKAWLSTVVENASTRLSHSTIPYAKITLFTPGTPLTKVADDWTDLTDGALDSAIDVTETGAVAGGNVWTDTLPGGGYLGTGACFTSWASNSALVSGGIGTTTSAASGWTATGALTCNQSARLYCLEQ